MVSDYFEIENFGVKAAPLVAASGVQPVPPVAAGGDTRTMSILGQRYQTAGIWKYSKQMDGMLTKF